MAARALTGLRAGATEKAVAPATRHSRMSERRSMASADRSLDEGVLHSAHKKQRPARATSIPPTRSSYFIRYSAMYDVLFPGTNYNSCAAGYFMDFIFDFLSKKPSYLISLSQMSDEAHGKSQLVKLAPGNPQN
jgi:hypothetical protein